MQRIFFRGYNLLTYFHRKSKNWEWTCGCSFKATKFGYLHNQCLEHYLD